MLNSDFRNSTIIDSTFSNANLQGVDFSNTYLYNNEKDKPNSFKGALYNSQAITCAESLLLSYEFKECVYEYCNNQTKRNLNACIDEFSRARSFISATRASKFPKNFDPENYEMIDIYKLVEFIKETRMDELKYIFVFQKKLDVNKLLL